MKRQCFSVCPALVVSVSKTCVLQLEGLIKVLHCVIPESQAAAFLIRHFQNRSH